MKQTKFKININFLWILEQKKFSPELALGIIVIQKFTEKIIKQKWLLKIIEEKDLDHNLIWISNDIIKEKLENTIKGNNIKIKEEVINDLIKFINDED